MRKVRVRLVQAAPVAFDTDATLTRFETWVERAGQEDAQLIVFPEAYVGGYPKGMDFGARVGFRRDAGRDWFGRYHAAAIEVPGPEVERMGKAFAKVRAQGVVGVIERDGGTLYCTALYFRADGTLQDKHRKLVPTGMERLIWGRGDGQTLKVQETPLGRVAAAICWENYMPTLRMHYYRQGVEIYCAPTVDDRDVWSSSMRHIAVEGRCFVLSCCQFATRDDYPADYPGEIDAVAIRGGSCVVDPFGEVLAGPLYGEAGLVSAEIDVDQVVRGKYDLDVAGHYDRPDVLCLQMRGSNPPGQDASPELDD